MITLRSFVFAAYVVIVGVALAFGMSTKTNASGLNTLNFITGMATTEATVYPHFDSCYPDGYWHCDEVGRTYQYALDLHNVPGGATGDAAVWLQAYGSPSVSVTAIFTVFTAGSVCPEVRADLYLPSGAWAGSVDYIQLYNFQVTSGSSVWLGSGWGLVYLGNVVNGPSSCGSTGSHLHQSGTNGTYMWSNFPVSADDDPNVSGNQIWATGSWTDNWLHQLAY
jgi:hypothetical protein